MWDQTWKMFIIPGLDGLQSRARETTKGVDINAVKLRVFHNNEAQESFRRKFVPMYRKEVKAVENDPCFSQIAEMRRQQYCRCLRNGLILGQMKRTKRITKTQRELIKFLGS
jgi:hypothetical protein